MSTREHHSHDVLGGRGRWWTDRLWEAAASLPVITVPIDSIVEFKRDCWFRGISVMLMKQISERLDLEYVANLQTSLDDVLNAP